MARRVSKLSSLDVNNLSRGKFPDGGGLWLYKRDRHAGQWVLRYTICGRRREMGLGSIHDVTLKVAREAAAKWCALVAEGKDPISERQRENRRTEKLCLSFEDVAKDAFQSRKAELKKDGRSGRWFSPLELHVLPKLGRRPISGIDQIEIRDTLLPIWHFKAPTARKALNRIGICIHHAAALGIEVDLHVTEKARTLLGQQRHVATNLPSLPWTEVPSFYSSLSQENITHLALRLLILTAVRSAPLRLIRTDEINGDVWTIPGEKQKGRKGKTPDFRVPLTPQALAVIGKAMDFSRDGYIFPGARRGVLSDAAMARLMERREMRARPHGFRSSFRDWIAEATDTPSEVAEIALGHVFGGKVERAYRRTDLLQKRRILLEEWASFVVGKSPNTTAAPIAVPKSISDVDI